MKIAFLQIMENNAGGVDGVNRTVARELTRNGHRVKMFYLRRKTSAPERPLPCGVEVFTARKNKDWHFTEGREIREALSNKRPFSAGGLFLRRLQDSREKKSDLKKIREALLADAPDRIIVSHYLLLEAVPEKFLSRTAYHAHTSFAATVENPDRFRVLSSYKGKIAFLWLSRTIREKAEEAGFAPSFFLYNPLPFLPQKFADPAAHRAVAVTRFSEEKRLGKMASLFRRAAEKANDPDWELHLFGTGDEMEKELAAISPDALVHYGGVTDKPEEEYAKASLSLNTSAFEGFSLSILESQACGAVPVTFRFGEAAEEEILPGFTGILAEQNNEEAFVNALVALMDDVSRRKRLGENARAWAKNFAPEKIAKEWEAFLQSAFPIA